MRAIDNPCDDESTKLLPNHSEKYMQNFINDDVVLWQDSF
jgi:hypothetical protein